MDRSRISYRIIIIVLYILFLLSCKNENFVPKEFGSQADSLFSLEGEYNISNNKELLFTSRIITTDGLTFYFTNSFARSIFSCNRLFKENTKIGRRGNGPGEYLSPVYINLYKDKLYYSDNGNNLIKHLNINRILASVSDSSFYITTAFGGRKFSVDNDYIYVLNETDALLKIYNKDNGELKQKMIEQSLFGSKNSYNFISSSIFGGGIAIDSLKNIFIAAPAPFIIYQITKVNNNFVVNNKWELSKLPFIKNLEERGLNRKAIRKSISRISIVMDLFLVGNNKQYLIAQVKTGRMAHCYIFSKSGTLIDIFSVNRSRLLGVYNDKLFFRFTDKEMKKKFIREFRLK